MQSQVQVHSLRAAAGQAPWELFGALRYRVAASSELGISGPLLGNPPEDAPLWPP